MRPLLSIAIIHYGSDNYLSRCIESIKGSTYRNIELIIIDNNGFGDTASNIGNISFRDLPYSYIRNKTNVGFAEGCNQGIRSSKGKYLFILNNDIELHKDCIALLVDFAEENSDVGMLQPKMLDFSDRETFHSSAAGGFIDVLGYPFARGRIFDTVEKDEGQYDDTVECFWVSGAALFARRDVLEEAGYFDPDFFLYMEEIDLAWRAHLLGYKVVYLPSAEIYHIGCPNLDRKNFLRMYFTHRNSLIMFIKNLSLMNLLVFFPLRFGLEMVTVAGSFTSFRGTRGLAILKAFGYILKNLPAIFNKRGRVQSMRKVKDSVILSNIYYGSIAVSYFLGRKSKVTDLKGFKVTGYLAKGGQI